MIKHWTLNAEGEPVECDFLAWLQWFENGEARVLRQDQVGSFKVSTVFLGVDHGWGDGPPLLWETMIFDDRTHAEAFDGYQERYSSRRAALDGHHRAVETVLRTLDTTQPGT